MSTIRKCSSERFPHVPYSHTRSPSTDPAFDARIRAVLAKAVAPAKAPGMLRLAFHDAGTFDAASGTGAPREMNLSTLCDLVEYPSRQSSRGADSPVSNDCPAAPTLNLFHSLVFNPRMSHHEWCASINCASILPPLHPSIPPSTCSSLRRHQWLHSL